MEFSEVRQSSPTEGGNEHASYESLRRRTHRSNVDIQRTPQYTWNPSSAEESAPKEGLRNVKDLPLPMGLKRALRQVQQMKVPVLTSWQLWKLSKSKAMKRFSEEAWSVLGYITLWRRPIHKIGGHFGGGVQSFFIFLRFLVVLNFLSFLLIAGFVLIPSIVFKSSTSASTPGTINNTNQSECTVYDRRPQSLLMFYEYFIDLLTGTGFMEYSYLFYGFYNNTVEISNGFSYNISLAYLLTAAFYFVFCLICIVVRMGSVVCTAVRTSGAALGRYSLLLFTGWDYGLQGDRATKLKQNSIHYLLQVDLEEERLKREAASLTLAQVASLYSLRALLNIIILFLIGGAFYSIFLATQYSQNTQRGDFLGLVIQYLPSIVITLANFVVPFLCDQISLLEKYSPSTTIILALLRAVFLRLFGLGILLFTLWSDITCQGQPNEQPCLHCQYNYKRYPCWETHVGQEMYKLAIFDFITVIVTTILVDFPRRMLVDHCSNKLVKMVGRQEFVVPQNVLGLVYGQTVVWTGAFFSPLLPVINTIKLIIIFYCKKITLFENCRPAHRTFRSSTSNVFFLLVLLFGWILATVALIYSVAEIHPSMSCGPFRLLSTMWSIVPNSFYSLPPTTQEFLRFIGSQAFSIPLFISMCVVLCYVAALASVYGKSVSLLRNQLKMEARDKQFLVRRIQELSSVARRTNLEVLD